MDTGGNKNIFAAAVPRRDLIAAAVGIVPASAAMLSVTGGGCGGDLADLDATLATAGIVDGAELTVRRSVVEQRPE